MIVAGDIHLADLIDETRRRVLVVSNDRFTAMAQRVLIAPEVASEIGEVAFPWRVDVNGVTFAIDLLRSVPVDRLLDRVDRASTMAMAQVRRAVVAIT